MSASTIIALVTGLIQIVSALVRLVEKDQWVKSGKAEAIAESLAAIALKVTEAKRVEADVNKLDDDAIARELSQYGYKR